jgi:starch synthase
LRSYNRSNKKRIDVSNSMTDNTRMKILMVATEAVPFAKEGGVADVIGSLPKELAALGHDVRIFIPRYGSIDPAHWNLHHTGILRTLPMDWVDHTVSVWQTTLPDSPVTVYMLGNDEFFGRYSRIYLGLEQREEHQRFMLFCRGLLEVLPALDFAPDIIHLHDWQAAPCAAYLRTTYRHLLRNGATRIVYTIHNLQYQGRWVPSILDECGLDRSYLFHPDGLEFWGDVNWMKAGIVYSDVISTVSHRYAQEIQTPAYGWGLDGVLSNRHARLFGIPNGLDWDVWNPATDKELTARYTAKTAQKAKVRNRSALRQAYGLADDPQVPFIGLVSRLVDQKGLDLIAAIVGELRSLPLQLFVLGSGYPYYEQLFDDLNNSTSNVRDYIGFNAALSRRIYASSDFFLMPSAFEPGGLGQLIALRYGTLPIVHATGGLADTVTDIDASPETGNGISFTSYSPHALLDALHRALRLYADRERWPSLLARAMAYDSRWATSAQAYSQLYQMAFNFWPM